MLARPATTKSTAKPATVSLNLETLEAREVPALAIALNYSLDTSGMFNPNTTQGQAARTALQRAADDLSSRIDARLAALAPNGGNSWSMTFNNPSTGGLTKYDNATVGADTIVVFVGGRDLPGNQSGVGGFGGYGWSGSGAWGGLVANRNWGGFSLWGGSLAFDTNGTPWSFGLGSDVPGNNVDFYSVAQHEMGHLLGLGTSNQWKSLVYNGAFHGGSAWGTYGAPVPVSADGAHWGNGVKSPGCSCPACMSPSLQYGVRAAFSDLDYAALKDIGWVVSAGGTTSAPPANPAPASSPPPAPTAPAAPLVHATGRAPIAVSGGGGNIQLFAQMGDGMLHAVSTPIHPFAGYNGEIRSAVGDFNGDGVWDVAVATAAGPAARVKIYSGSGGEIVGETIVLGGFTGGAFLAAGDTQRDGKDELVVGADKGGGPRVTVFDVRGGQLLTQCDFYAFGTPGYAGGARVAMGDVDGDGLADLIVVAGPGGGPRVSSYAGRSLFGGDPGRLYGDFFAMDPGLRMGLYVTAGDINGDGKADLVFTADANGSSRMVGYSGAFLTAGSGVDPLYAPQFFSRYTTDANAPAGTRVTARDVDGDGKVELVITTALRTDSTLRVWKSRDVFNPGMPALPYQQVVAVPDPLGIWVG